jgi:hypothetical protein
VHLETKKLTKEGRWDDLWKPITDEMLDTFTVMGEPKDIAPKIKQRFGDFVDTIQSNLELKDEEVQYRIIKEIEAIRRTDAWPIAARGLRSRCGGRGVTLQLHQRDLHQRGSGPYVSPNSLPGW